MSDRSSSSSIEQFLQSIETRHVVVALVLGVLLGVFTGMLSDLVTAGIKRATKGGWLFYATQSGLLVAIIVAIILIINFAVVKPMKKATEKTSGAADNLLLSL